MKVCQLVFILAITISFCQCKTRKASTTTYSSATATVVQEGFITCFEPGLTAASKPVWCEASAIVYDGSKLFFANDKEMPGARTSLFYLPIKNGFIDTALLPAYSENFVIKNGRKYEDFAKTPDDNYIFLSTGFDRVKEGSTDWDSYNTILYWKKGDEDHPKVVSRSGTDSTSVSLRQSISKALTSSKFSNGAPYFKIEGLAVTSDTMYLGVREEGKNYNEFDYKIKILSAPYTITNDRLSIGNISLLVDFNIPAINPSPQPIAISSMEYDHFNNRFLILTSYEQGDTLGGFLWIATPDELKAHTLHLVKDAQGKAIDFHHKCEDVAVISKKRVIVIDDDDRVVTKISNKFRQPNQAAYSILDFE